MAGKPERRLDMDDGGVEELHPGILESGEPAIVWKRERKLGAVKADNIAGPASAKAFAGDRRQTRPGVRRRAPLEVSDQFLQAARRE